MGISLGSIGTHSFLFTDQGLIKVQGLYPSWRSLKPEAVVDLSVTLAGGGKSVKAVKFCYGGVKRVKVVTTESGLDIAATEEQQVRSLIEGGGEWLKASELRTGKVVAVPVGMDLWGQAPFKGERVTIPTWTREAFLHHLRVHYPTSLVRRAEDLQLLTNSKDEALILRLMLMNLGLMSKLDMSQTSCCQKSFVSLRGTDALILESWIVRGDNSGFLQQKFRYIPDVVKKAVSSSDHVFDLVVPEGGHFAGQGFMIAARSM